MKNKYLIYILAGLVIIFSTSYFIYNKQDNYTENNIAGEVAEDAVNQNDEIVEGSIEGSIEGTNESAAQANTTTPISSEIIEEQTVDEKEVYVIDYVNMYVQDEEYSLNISSSTSVYEFMQNLSASSIKPFIFTAKNYGDMGYFVESINGIENDIKQNKYWIYYINNEPAKIGISDYILKPEDQINWKFEEAKF